MSTEVYQSCVRFQPFSLPSMESALSHFREGYINGDRVQAILALNMLASNAACGIDDMIKAKELIKSQFFGSQIAEIRACGLEKWLIISTLLTNCNFLESKARSDATVMGKCLVLCVERTNVMLNFFIDAMQNNENNPNFGSDIDLLAVLLRRMRTSVRHLASFGSFDFDPISLYSKALTKCYFFLSKAVHKLKKSMKSIRGKIKNAIGDVLIEIWRINPFSVGVEVKPSDLHSIAFYSSAEKSAALYLFYSIFLLSKGNIRDAERALAKSAAFRGRSTQENVLFFWSVMNMHRGYFPRQKYCGSSYSKSLNGLILGMKTGRIDIFDAACLAHVKRFVRMNIALPVFNIRLVIFRNMIAKYRLRAHQKEKIDINDLCEKNKDILNIGSGETYFLSMEALRDEVLLPLAIQRIINGCVHVNHNILNLSVSNAFPDLDLASGPMLQPLEPVER